MHLVGDSITVVLVGDWNKLYIDPAWVANNVFESANIDIGVEGKGSLFSISYKKNNVIIKPTQTKIVFSSTDAQQETLEFLSKCVNNYIEKSFTPSLSAYGFNCNYFDEEDTRLADVFDGMSDTEAVLKLGYEIETSQIKRKLSKNGKIINMECDLDHTKTTIHFNEHHASPEKDDVIINTDTINEFIKEAQDIVESFGYEIEVG